ncbi:MAG: hypothetical protein C4308_14815 [Chitinophagaceae bacterium]
MKTFLKKFFFVSSVALFSAFSFVSCDSKDDDNNSNDYTVSGNASGSQMVPPISGTATGTFIGTYNTQTNQLAYTMAWAGLTGTATAAGFYNGNVGVNGSLVANAAITTSGSTGASAGVVTLTEAQEQALLSGNMYYLVSTAAHASGEIRGQLTATAQ